MFKFELEQDTIKVQFTSFEKSLETSERVKERERERERERECLSKRERESEFV